MQGIKQCGGKGLLSQAINIPRSGHTKNLYTSGAKKRPNQHEECVSNYVSFAALTIKLPAHTCLRLPLLLTLVGALLMFIDHAQGQELRAANSVAIATPTAFSTNQMGNLFLGDAQGMVRAYNPTGQVTHTFSPPRVAEVASLDAGQNLRMLCFYRDLQEYLLLDRFLTPLPGYEKPVKISPTEVGFARLAALAQDGQLWLFDDTDFSLKKYNPATRRLSLNVPLELVLSGQDPLFVTLREYQNLLFLHDRRGGVLVFDNAGNFRSKIAAEAAESIGFYGDELYFIQRGVLHFLHLYSGAVRELRLPGSVDLLGVAVGSTSIYVLSRNQLIVYSKPL